MNCSACYSYSVFSEPSIDMWLFCNEKITCRSVVEVGRAVGSLVFIDNAMVTNGHKQCTTRPTDQLISVGKDNFCGRQECGRASQNTDTSLICQISDPPTTFFHHDFRSYQVYLLKRKTSLLAKGRAAGPGICAPQP